MVKSYLKEEERIGEKILKFPCLYQKGNKGYKEKDGKKTHDMKFSLLNEILNFHILFENVIFVKLVGTHEIKNFNPIN